MGGMYMDNFLHHSLQITQYNQYWNSQSEMIIRKTKDDMGRYQYQDSQEFKGNKKCVGMFDHQRDTQNLSVLSVIYGNGVTRIPLSYSGTYQNFSAVELNSKNSKLECPRQTWRTAITRNNMEKGYDINTYRAVHRPSTTMSCDMSVGTLRSAVSGNRSEPLPISHRRMQTSIHPFQNHRARSLILSEEDKSHLTVVCQPINNFNRQHSARPLWSRHWQKEQIDSTTAFEELQFSPNYPANDKCSFDSLTPQIMACFISQEGVSEMKHPKTRHRHRSVESLSMNTESSRALTLNQINGDDDEEEEERENMEKVSKSLGADGGDEDCESVPLTGLTSTYYTSDLIKAVKDFKTCEETESKSIVDPEKKEFEECSKQLNSDNVGVGIKENLEETREENKNLEDFDAMSTEIPAYLFKEPLPYPLNKLDISQMSREKVNWREVVRWYSVDTLMHSLLDRLFEIAQRQHETEESEIRRSLTKQAMRIKPRPLNSRQLTNVTLKTVGREKRCPENCLQSACVGNSPDKQRIIPSSVCHFCYQSLFGRNGQEEYSYDQQSRLPADKELWRNLATTVTSVPTVAIRPRSCNAEHPHCSPNRLSLAKAKNHRPKSSTVPSCMMDCSHEMTFQNEMKHSSELKTSNSRPKSTISKPTMTKSKSNNLFPGKSHHSSEWNFTTSPDIRDASLLVQSAKSDRKTKKKDKRNLTSISLLDP